MLKLLGAILIIGSCGALGLSARQDLRTRIAAIDGCLKALERMESEIAYRLTPSGELIGLLAKEGDGQIAPVFQSMADQLSRNDGLSLAYKWSRALRETGPTCGLKSEEIGVLCDASAFLGRYDSEQQLQSLRLTRSRLDAVRGEAAEDLKNKGNLYRTCGLAFGLLAVIVLL